MNYLFILFEIIFIDYLTIILSLSFIPIEKLNRDNYFNIFRGFIWYIDSIILSMYDDIYKFFENKELNVLFSLLYSFLDDMMDNNNNDNDNNGILNNIFNIVLSGRLDSCDRSTIVGNLIYHFIKSPIECTQNFINLYKIQVITMKLQKYGNQPAENLFIYSALKGIYSLLSIQELNNLSIDRSIVIRYGIVGQMIDDILDTHYDKRDNIHTLATDYPIDLSFHICHNYINRNPKDILRYGFNLYLYGAKKIHMCNIVNERNKLRNRFNDYLHNILNLWTNF